MREIDYQIARAEVDETIQSSYIFSLYVIKYMTEKALDEIKKM